MSVLKKCYVYDPGAPTQYKYTSIINPLSEEPKWAGGGEAWTALD